MAHKKAGGSSRNGRDSEGQRFGVKRYAGQKVKAGLTEVGIQDLQHHLLVGDLLVTQLIANGYQLLEDDSTSEAH